MYKLFTFSSLIILFHLSINLYSQNIDSSLFSQNAWYINKDELDTNKFSDSLDAQLPSLASIGVKFIRIGGIGVNFKPLYNFNSGSLAIVDAPRLKHLIDTIRACGMEPIIQVGYKPANICTTLTPFLQIPQANQATIAGNLVKFLNNPDSGLYKTKPLMHFIIANEPNLEVNCSDYKGFGYENASDTDATFIVSYLKDFSRAMKNACSDTACTNIKIIGPEIAGFSNDSYSDTWDLMRDIIADNDLMDTITSGPATGKFLIDAVSIHPYSRCTTRADVIDNPAVYDKSFKNKISSNTSQYKGIAEIISTYSSRVDSNLKIACTEFNLSYNDTNEIETTDTGYANMIKGIGYRSYLSSQWMAEVYSEAMKSGRVRYLAPWSVKEKGSETGSATWPQNPCKEGKGFFSECDSSVAGPNHTRPIYWGYKMIAENFAGTYLTQKCTTNDSVYKAFAYKNTATNPDEIGVVVMNQNIQSPRGTDASTKSFKINFNNTLPSGSDTMKFYFDASLNDSVTCTITNETTMLLVFNATNGDLLRKEVYSLGHALRKPDTGPEVWGISSSLNIANQNDFDNYYDAVYPDINISPTSAIIENSGDNKIIRFSNSVTMGGGSADFTIPADADFTLLPTEDCPD